MPSKRLTSQALPPAPAQSIPVVPVDGVIVTTSEKVYLVITPRRSNELRIPDATKRNPARPPSDIIKGLIISCRIGADTEDLEGVGAI